MGSIGCPETSARNYHYVLLYITENHRTYHSEGNKCQGFCYGTVCRMVNTTLRKGVLTVHTFETSNTIYHLLWCNIPVDSDLRQQTTFPEILEAFAVTEFSAISGGRPREGVMMLRILSYITYIIYHRIIYHSVYNIISYHIYHISYITCIIYHTIYHSVYNNISYHIYHIIYYVYHISSYRIS